MTKLGFLAKKHNTISILQSLVLEQQQPLSSIGYIFLKSILNMQCLFLIVVHPIFYSLLYQSKYNRKRILRQETLYKFNFIVSCIKTATIIVKTMISYCLKQYLNRQCLLFIVIHPIFLRLLSHSTYGRNTYVSQETWQDFKFIFSYTRIAITIVRQWLKITLEILELKSVYFSMSYTHLFRGFNLSQIIAKLGFLAKKHNKRSISFFLVLEQPQPLLFIDYILPTTILD